jgi:hypothetical protein
MVARAITLTTALTTPLTIVMVVMVFIPLAVTVARLGAGRVILLHSRRHQREDFTIASAQGVLATKQRGQVDEVAAYPGRRGKHAVGPHSPQ